MKKCENCNSPFLPKRITAKYCSQSCKVRAYEKRKGIKEPNFLNNTQEHKLSQLKKEKDKYIIERKSLIESNNKIINDYNLKLEELNNGKSSYYAEKIVEAKNIEHFLMASLLSVGHSYNDTNKEKILKKHKKEIQPILITNKEKFDLLNRKISDLENDIDKLNRNISKKYEIKQAERKIFDIQEILNTNFNSYQFDGKYSIIGNPESNFKMQIWGTKGQGKSYFTIKFADYLTRFGKVFYNSSEEGISLSFQNKLRTIENIKHIKVGIHKNYDSLKKDLRKNNFQFLILDSLNDMNMNLENLNEIKNLYPTISITYICQATKDNKSKGDERLKHFADVVIEIKDREIILEKTRYV